ncbi:MAG: hypothetical protein JW863_23525 [Chitinispirillaceae bacterium]|nr:hypothetical protein [Chitinispirillaceae bacterium]
MPSKFATVNLEGDAMVPIPMRLLVSLINTVDENALQVFMRRHNNLEGFHVDADRRNGVLTIEGTAGGFDVSSVALGKSSKGSGHGIFLSTLLNDTSHRGIRPSIERTEKERG